MAFVEWDESMKVNVEHLDEQHKGLVETVNKLHDAMKAGKGRDVLDDVLSSLIEYTSVHFKSEERLFDEYKYEHTAQHKKQHAELVKQVLEIKEKFDNGEPMVTMNLMNFLRDWLVNHIMGSDKKYSTFMNENGVY